MGTKVCRNPNHNGVRIFWSFTTLPVSIQSIPLFKYKSVLNVESNARKFIEDLNNDRNAIISKEMTHL